MPQKIGAKSGTLSMKWEKIILLRLIRWALLSKAKRKKIQIHMHIRH